MIRPWLIGLGIIAALCAALWWQAGQLADVRAERDAAQAEIAAWEEAQRVLDRFADQRRDQLRDAAILDRELEQGEGADAPLSDYLRRGAGRVWR